MLNPGPYFEGRRALVVGGSQGIGLSLAQQLTELGCEVTVAARNQSRLDSVTGSLVGSHSLSLDVSDESDTQKKLEKLCRTDGVPDFVFNCAGLAHPGYLDDQSPRKLREMMDVNFFGTMVVCRTLLPYFKQRGSGVFVNTSSLGGLMGLFGYTGYCASKYAVVGFSEALRREVKPYGLHVTLLCPPNTKTPGLSRENLSKPQEVLAQEKNVKEVEPDFVANKLLKALPRNPSLVIPTLDGWLAYYLSRFAPTLLDKFLRRPVAH